MSQQIEAVIKAKERRNTILVVVSYFCHPHIVADIDIRTCSFLHIFAIKNLFYLNRFLFDKTVLRNYSDTKHTKLKQNRLNHMQN